MYSTFTPFSITAYFLYNFVSVFTYSSSSLTFGIVITYSYYSVCIYAPIIYIYVFQVSYFLCLYFRCYNNIFYIHSYWYGVLLYIYDQLFLPLTHFSPLILSLFFSFGNIGEVSANSLFFIDILLVPIGTNFSVSCIWVRSYDTICSPFSPIYFKLDFKFCCWSIMMPGICSHRFQSSWIPLFLQSNVKWSHLRTIPPGIWVNIFALGVFFYRVISWLNIFIPYLPRLCFQPMFILLFQHLGWFLCLQHEYSGQFRHSCHFLCQFPPLVIYLLVC